jgi:hypothetical protein
MDKNLNIRNSTAEFLIFTSQNGEDKLNESSVCREFRHTVSEKYRLIQDNIYMSDFDKLMGEL